MKILIIHDDVERAITMCVWCSRISEQKEVYYVALRKFCRSLHHLVVL